MVEVDGLFHIVLSWGGESAGSRVVGISIVGASVLWRIMANVTVCKYSDSIR